MILIIKKLLRTLVRSAAGIFIHVGGYGGGLYLILGGFVYIGLMFMLLAMAVDVHSVVFGLEGEFERNDGGQE